MNSTLLSLPATTARRTRIATFGIGVGLALFVASMAAGQSGPPPGGGKSGPPPEALSACNGKAIDDSCEMNTPRGGQSVPGQCVTTPDKQLACLPQGAPPPQN